ncbi:MAG TPA: ATP-binding protein [Chitinophagales bacterium]|nr:ATP-binding protein [Chitinophagales bacterium]
MNTSTATYEEVYDLVAKAEQFVDRRSPEALPLAEQIMQQAVQNRSAHLYALANYIHAFYQCVVLNDYDKCIELCDKALERLRDEGDMEIAYMIYMTQGNAYQFRGEVYSAQEHYMRGLKQLENRDTLNKREKGFLASFYYNLSLVMGTTKLNMDSEEYLLRAIKLYEETENYFKLSKSYGAYTWLLEKRQEFDKAIETTKKALDIDLRLNDPFSIAVSRANLGLLYLRVKEIDNAFSYLKDSLNYFTETNSLYYMAMVKNNVGETLCTIGKIKEGIAELHESEKLFEQLDNRQELTSVYQALSKYYKADGNFEMALEYMTRHLAGVNQFYDLEKTNALTRAKKEFETEQKEKEAKLLKEKNDQISLYVHKLEVSNNELKQFAQVASHDMREPLRMIYSYVGLIERSLGTNITAQQKEFISYALDGSKRMDALIQDLLHLAKVDANPKREPLKMNMIVEELKWNLDALTREKNAQIISVDLPVLIADRTQMLQLFQNLIANGIKYNRGPEPTIHIGCKHRPGEVEISIADNGPGIPANQREKVFQIFQRLHANRDIAGTGMGLAICRKIVESMNGKIWIEDNVKGGTVFVFTLSTNL